MSRTESAAILAGALRALACSVLATGADVLVTVFLTRTGLDAGPSTLFGGVVGGVLGFVSMRSWGFPGARGGTGRQALRYAIASATAALLNAIAVGALTGLGAGLALASIIGRLAVWLGWTLPSARLYVFPARPREERG